MPCGIGSEQDAGRLAPARGGRSGTFKRTIADRPALSHMVGLALLAATIALVPFVEPLTYSLATTSVLVLVAVWETLSLRTPPTPGMKSSAGTPAVS